MKKAYLTPSLMVVEIRYGHLLSVSGKSVLIQLDDTEIDMGFGGIDEDGTIEPM